MNRVRTEAIEELRHMVLDAAVWLFGSRAGAGEIAWLFLPKPYSLAEIARRIRSLLEDPQLGNA